MQFCCRISFDQRYRRTEVQCAPHDVNAPSSLDRRSAPVTTSIDRGRQRRAKYGGTVAIFENKIRLV
jgi:hypothetical protein